MNIPVRNPMVAALVLALLLGRTAGALAAGLPAFSEIVKANASAVVNISTTRKLTGDSAAELPGNPFPRLPEGNPFNEFFKRFGEPHQLPPGAEARSLGSGFIVSSDGYILTNAHVIKDADEVTVRLSDHREKQARVIGADDRTDVALLKIDASGLETVKVGDPEKLEVGDWVLAIGSPFGLEHTATQGIVSALGRNLPSDTYVPFIQTDVAVNPGNSGGPLFDTDGKVVGINSQIYSSSGGYMGLSFAIPIDVAMGVSEQLKAHGHVTRGWLGVMIQPVNQELADSFGLERPTGALVARVVPGGPADRAGLEAGDVIVEYNGDAIDEVGKLPPLVGSTPIDDVVPVTVVRGRKKREIEVTIGALPDDDAATRLAATGGDGYQLNMTVANLSADERKALGPEANGVLVKEVDAGPAAAAGIRAGDVLVMVNREGVKDVDQLVHIVESLPVGKPVPVLVERDHNPLFLALTVPKA